MKVISIPDIYVKYSDEFDGFQDFFEFLLNNHTNIWFNTKLDKEYSGIDDSEDITLYSQSDLPTWLSGFSSQGNSYKGVEGVIIPSSEIRDKFISRRLELSKSILRQVLLNYRDEVVSLLLHYISKKPFENIVIPSKIELQRFEDRNISFLDLYCDDTYISNYFSRNKLLDKYIKPNKDFSRLSILVDGEYVEEELSGYQPVILQELYENSLHDRDYVLPARRIIEIKGHSTKDIDTAIKPSNLFKTRKYIRNYLEKRGAGIAFKYKNFS